MKKIEKMTPFLRLYIGVLLINMLAAAAVAYVLFRSLEHSENSHARSITENLAETLKQSIQGNLGQINIGLLAVKEEIERQLAAGHPDKLALAEYMKAMQQRLPGVIGLRATDADGWVCYGVDVPSDRRVSNADRPHFQAHRDDADQGLFIGLPVLSRINNVWVINLSRRLNDAHGAFAGVVFANIPLDNFRKMFDVVDVGRKGAINLRYGNMELLVRQPKPDDEDSLIGKADISAEFQSMLDSGFRSGGTFSTSTSFDGTPRLVSYRKIADYPLYVSVGLAKEDYLAEWRIELQHMLIFFLIFMLTSLVGAWLIAQSWLAKQAEDLQHVNALENEIKQRRIVEAELASAKDAAETANRTKSLFLANMSHELRTPLNAILGFSEMISRNPETPDALKEKVAIINRSGEHLLSMINDVLDLSKIEAGKLAIEVEAIDLPELIDDIGRMFEVRADAAGLLFSRELAPESACYIQVDSKKLRQVLINLLGNAVKFTREGGFALRVRTQPVADDPSALRLHLEVQDSGPGIPADQQPNLFKPFVQLAATASAQKGTGLGLSISKSLVELMGGTIGVDSTPGQGALFWVDLPVAVAASVPSAVSNSLREVVRLAPDQPVWRILVAEDNPDNRLLLISQLYAAGFDVREAENGEEAVALFAQWQPHLIWMDMRMPVHDGYQATRRIRALPGGDQVKIVAITASVFKEQHARILEAGCDAVVHKPCRRRDILETMERLLGLRYSYQQTETTLLPTVSETVLLRALAKLERSMRDELIHAAELGDQERFEAELSKLDDEQAEWAEFLLRLAENYRFDVILRYLERKADR